MKEHDLDRLLEELYKEDIQTPEHLVKRTQSLYRKPTASPYLVGLALLVNLLALFALAAFVFFTPYHYLIKLGIYVVISSASNLLILMMYLHQDRIRDFVNEMEMSKS